MRSLAKIMSMTALSLSLAGCVSILPDPLPADVVYRLSSPMVSVPAAPNARIVRVDRPTAPKVLSGNDIIVSPTGGSELITAAGARWSETIPILVQQSMLDELGQHPALTGIGPLSGARSEIRLHITIKNFEAQFDQGAESAPLAVAHYMVTLSDASTRSLIGTYDTRHTIRANAVRVSAIVDAQEKANRLALDDIAGWVGTLAAQS